MRRELNFNHKIVKKSRRHFHHGNAPRQIYSNGSIQDFALSAKMASCASCCTFGFGLLKSASMDGTTLLSLRTARVRQAARTTFGVGFLSTGIISGTADGALRPRNAFNPSVTVSGSGDLRSVQMAAMSASLTSA